MSNKKKLENAVALLNEISANWKEDDVVSYPQGLNSFDEVVALISGIELKESADPRCQNCDNAELDTIKESAKRELVCLKCEAVLYRKLEVGVDDAEIESNTGERAEDHEKGQIFFLSYDGFWAVWNPKDEMFWTMAGNEDELFHDVFVALAWVRERMS